MVMEAPSPQQVGREFVRQYYTMLHESPPHLHRFYSENSTFIHDGNKNQGIESKPAVGQKEIHKKICDLDFLDCHAKIHQVDSHATIGSGVVVQVIGELSNNGQPLRRFVQTFVLAQQGAKQYYVHNDIFRYQDTILTDDEDQGEDEESVTVGCDVIDPPISPRPSVVETTANGYYAEKHTSPSAVQLNDSQSALTNGVEEDDTIDVGQGNESADLYEQGDQGNEGSGSEQGNMTWAGITRKTRQGPGNNAAAAVTAAPPRSKPTSFQLPPAAPKGPAPAPAVSTQPKPPRENTPRRPAERPPRPAPKEGPPAPRAGSQSEEDRFNPTTHYPDNQQVFIGNLPPDLSPEDIRQEMSRYGTVIDVRINPGGKGNMSKQGKNVPNFGFVVFEDAASVLTLMSGEKQKNLFINNHRINVETKKNRERTERPIGGGERDRRSGGGGPRGSSSGSGPTGRPKSGGPGGRQSYSGGGGSGSGGDYRASKPQEKAY